MPHDAGKPDTHDALDVHNAALTWQEAGASVVRAAADGTKRPLGNWKHHQANRANEKTVDSWFANGHPGLGVVCGTVSGNLEMLELESRAVDEFGPQFFTALDDHGLSHLRDQLGAYCEVSPSGGMHFYYRLDGDPVPGNLVLAGNEEHKPLIETRGEGGFSIVAPSHGDVHPTGKPWLVSPTSSGGPADIPTLTTEERDQLHAVCALFDRRPERPQPIRTERAPRHQSAGASPGDDYNERGDWDLLADHGWTLLARTDSDGSGKWNRPNARNRHGVDAVTGGQQPHLMWIFSTSSDGVLPAGETITRFGAYALLEHGGDMSAAARELGHQGYGDQTPPNSGTDIGAQVIEFPTADHIAPTSDTATLAAATSREDGSSLVWDIGRILDEGMPEPKQPTFGPRTDGRHLFYPEAVNMVYAMPEQGKSMLSTHTVADALKRGCKVGWIDADHNGVQGILPRLLAVDGVEPDMLRHQLIAMDPATPNELHQATELLIRCRAELVIIDSVTEAMTLHGKDNNDAGDYTQVNRWHAARLARDGACVIVVDHLNRQGTDADTAAGTLAKKNSLDGVQVQLRKGDWMLGKGGSAELVVTKDRHGAVRRDNPSAGVGRSLFGTLHMGLPDMAGTQRMVIEPPQPPEPGEATAQPFDRWELDRVVEAVDKYGKTSQGKLATWFNRSELAEQKISRDRVRDIVKHLLDTGQLWTKNRTDVLRIPGDDED